jgi:hypothetical protein
MNCGNAACRIDNYVMKLLSNASALKLLELTPLERNDAADNNAQICSETRLNMRAMQKQRGDVSSQKGESWAEVFRRNDEAVV